MSQSRYDQMLGTLADIVADVEALAGNEVSNPPMPWQGIALRLHGSLKMYLLHLEAVRDGGTMIVFPSIDEAMEARR